MISQTLQKKLISNRPLFDDLVKRKFIFCPTADIYGGIAGLFDYGPIGTGIKNNLIQMWKNHFIVEEDLLEICCTTLTPQVVLKNSGHEERFIDWMVKDVESGESFRADHLIEDFIDKEIKKEGLSASYRDELDQVKRRLPNFANDSEFEEIITRYKLLNPTNNKGKLGAVYPFNLMFDCRVGPLGDQKAYLRPETAQSIFCNFKKLLEFNNGKLPFGASIVGRSYRNEIAPRQGLLRVREFEMAEIEFFIDPTNTHHPKLKDVKYLELPLFSREQQQNGELKQITIDIALEQKIIQNEILAYFIARTYLFAKAIGLKEEMLRFRQHQKGEMAHYASDCWDLEVLTSYGWVECVGLADRAAYDLNAHTRGSGEKLFASRVLPTPVSRQSFVLELNKGEVAKTFKAETARLLEAVENMSEEIFCRCEKELQEKGMIEIEGFNIKKSMIKEMKRESKMVQEEKFIPNVIEPSFGIGRLVYAVLEHSFSFRSDAKRTFFSFNPILAPYKVVFLPLINKEELTAKAETFLKLFRQEGLNCRADCGSSAIGRRYARTDEIGIPFAVTVDFRTLEDDTVTLREIEGMEQIRLPGNELLCIVKSLICRKTSWSDLTQQFPLYLPSEESSEQ